MCISLLLILVTISNNFTMKFMSRPNGLLIHYLSFNISNGLFEVNSFKFFVIFLTSQFHHLIFKRCFIVISSNLFLINLAGLPATIVYALTSFVTTELAPIIAPSPILTPGNIVTF